MNWLLGDAAPARNCSASLSKSSNSRSMIGITCAGDVLVDLRVLERARPALAALLLVLVDGYLHRRKIAKPDRD